ncbi:unnamed protein product [Paramecium pentaurelia]|uniref:Uncharacterized protein n=1 Tax=Paramecium pentaurelia TaxID=43138 RepID=A0A8S1XEL0_9CILI|nr:unnamed protein product [Paramecium pentaurelia]
MNNDSEINNRGGVQLCLSTLLLRFYHKKILIQHSQFSLYYCWFLFVSLPVGFI